MKIKVLGKAHLEGVSKKTGSPYNFNQIHYLGKAPGVEGQAALTASLDSTNYPFSSIVVGQEYNLEYNGRGYVVDFTPVR